jgi:hypothetical protein
MRRWLSALVVLLGMAGVGMAATAPVASAAKPTCRVVDTNAGQSYTSLQDAVTAASAGDRLFVKGTCFSIVEIGKNLTIAGQSAGGNKTATLSGGGQSNVLTIDPGVTVTLNTLIITNGAAPFGGGILNVGTLTLNGSTVTGNTAFGGGGGSGGGGIFNHGTLTLNGSTVTGNTAPNASGGGIFNDCGGTLVGAVAAPAPGANVFANTPDNIFFNNVCP